MRPMRMLALLVSLLLTLGTVLIGAPSTSAAPHVSTVEQLEKKPKPSAKKHKPAKHKPAKKHTPAKKQGAAHHAVKIPKAKAPKAVKGRVCPVRAFAFGDGFGADRGKRSHLGQDMSGRRGAPLFAVESGYINRTKRQSNKALQIVLQGKSGSKYYYGHMDRVFIRGGQRVKAGQVIGVMGDTGSPGQVHLHFEYWKSGGESDAIDPEPFIRRICRR